MRELSTTLDEAFNTQTEEGTPDFQPLPAGNYVATIVDAKVGPLKSGKGQAVLLQWEVQGGANQGRLIFDHAIVAHESAEAMKFGRRPVSLRQPSTRAHRTSNWFTSSPLAGTDSGFDSQ